MTANETAVHAAVALLLENGYCVMKAPQFATPTAAPSSAARNQEDGELAFGKDAYSVDEFCMLFGIGRTFFYDLLKNNKGPQLMKVGRRTLISRNAADHWRKSMEACS